MWDPDDRIFKVMDPKTETLADVLNSYDQDAIDKRAYFEILTICI